MNKLIAAIFGGLTLAAGGMTMTHVPAQSPDISVRESSGGHRLIGPGYGHGK